MGDTFLIIGNSASRKSLTSVDDLNNNNRNDKNLLIASDNTPVSDSSLLKLIFHIEAGDTGTPQITIDRDSNGSITAVTTSNLTSYKLYHNGSLVTITSGAPDPSPLVLEEGDTVQITTVVQTNPVNDSKLILSNG